MGDASGADEARRIHCGHGIGSEEVNSEKVGRESLAQRAVSNLPITFTVACRTGSLGRGRRHPVTIHPDWSVETPHNIEAERIAIALGGSCSCVDLLDRTIPALLEWKAVQGRETPLDIAGSPTGWSVAGNEACRCSRTTFPNVYAAAEHARDLTHVRIKHSATQRQLEELINAFAPSPDRIPMPTGYVEAAARVRESDGLRQLWDAGIHPARVIDHLKMVDTVDDTLPVPFFLGAAYSGIDHAWFVDNLTEIPTAEAATWLIWWKGDTTTAAAGDYGRWLALGIPPRQVNQLVELGVTPAYARDIASTLGQDAHTTARDLARWANIGCVLTADHLARLAELGVNRTPPSSAAIDELSRNHTRFRHLDRTTLAVLLAAAGTISQATLAITRGVQTLEDYVAYAEHRT